VQFDTFQTSSKFWLTWVGVHVFWLFSNNTQKCCLINCINSITSISHSKKPVFATTKNFDHICMASLVDNWTRNRGCRYWFFRAHVVVEHPGRARTWKSMRNGHLFEMHTNSKSEKHVSNSYSSGWDWAHREREDDARRHCNGPGPRTTPNDVE
jgi:hypothetical protein